MHNYFPCMALNRQTKQITNMQTNPISKQNSIYVNSEDLKDVRITNNRLVCEDEKEVGMNQQQKHVDKLSPWPWKWSQSRPESTQRHLSTATTSNNNNKCQGQCPFIQHTFTPYFEKHARGTFFSFSSPLGRFNLAHAVFLCDHTSSCEAYSFTTDGYGIFNMRKNLGACRAHEGWSSTNT